MALSDRDVEVLELERQWWRYAGVKETEVRERFGLRIETYYQVLNTILDDPDALAYDAQLVRRLLRLRAARQRARGSRTYGYVVDASH